LFEQHFNMIAQPFTERLVVEKILQDERLRQGLMRLKYLSGYGSIALLTGHTGVGKSSLIKLFLNTLDNHYNPVYVHLTHIKTASLLKQIVSGMGEIPGRTKENLFNQIIEKAKRTEALTIVIIDEAHLISSEALIDIRLLVSSALEDTPSLKIIFSGQENIRKLLRQASLQDLANRISVKYHLPSLSLGQSIAYLDHQMKNAGSNDKIFESQVKNFIHEYSNGIPRQINNIATACLIEAVTTGAQKITQDIFSKAVRECQI